MSHFLSNLGEVESIRQNRCQSGVPLHNGATRKRSQAPSNFTSRTHKNCPAFQGHQKREDSRNADVSGKFRNVQNPRQLFRGMSGTLAEARFSLQ